MDNKRVLYLEKINNSCRFSEFKEALHNLGKEDMETVLEESILARAIIRKLGLPLASFGKFLEKRLRVVWGLTKSK